MRKIPTIAEKKLWNRLRYKQMIGLKFRRQQPIDDIIVDFVNFDKKIVIEVMVASMLKKRKKTVEGTRD